MDRIDNVIIDSIGFNIYFIVEVAIGMKFKFQDIYETRKKDTNASNLAYVSYASLAYHDLR